MSKKTKDEQKSASKKKKSSGKVSKKGDSTASATETVRKPKAATKRPAIRRTSARTGSTRAKAHIPVSREDIERRAYFIAERRKKMGWPGDETSDWVDAEAQLLAEAKRPKNS